jgi:hypothetical protein
MAYPVADDLVAFAAASGLIDLLATDEAMLQDLLDAAVEDFEAQTGWTPFLSSGADSARTFGNYPHALDKNLYLPGGLTSITSIVADGVTLTANDHYFVRPVGVTPIRWIEFVSTWTAQA